MLRAMLSRLLQAVRSLFERGDVTPLATSSREVSEAERPDTALDRPLRNATLSRAVSKPFTAPTTTKKILALKALNRTCAEECVDWAIGQIERGINTRHVLMLSGMTPPFNHFEMSDLRDRALGEVAAEPMAYADAVKVIAAETAADALHGRIDMLSALHMLNRLCIDEDYPPDLKDFYLLYFAWDDLLTSEIQWYWPGATRDNVAAIAEEIIRGFVASARTAGMLDDSR
jgi:hypothetical protein